MEICSSSAYGIPTVTVFRQSNVAPPGLIGRIILFLIYRQREIHVYGLKATGMISTMVYPGRIPWRAPHRGILGQSQSFDAAF